MPNNIQNEIDLLEKMIKHNNNLIDVFEASRKAQRDTINLMKNEGMSKSHLQKLEEHVHRNELSFKRIRIEIETIHNRQIRSIIKELERHR